ncbi:MAG TPA: DUF72 domain-containing protein [Pirellulales bacterium]|nr:DUF72 domain-containing protein [Pirellulales bacterium]
MICVGCAGWNVPRAIVSRFAEAPSHLARYASRLPAVEINTSFYRPHKPATYARWADTVGDGFRFAVKVPRAMTHEAGLAVGDEEIAEFVAQVAGLGQKLGVLLVQLPPSLAFDARTAESFFAKLREQTSGAIVCEPRHASWFETTAEKLLARDRIARVAADPARHAGAGAPGGWDGIVYYRLHGSPHTYYSSYSDEYLHQLAQQLRSSEQNSAACWCIFDNTAAGAAADNALALLSALSG